MDSCSGRECAVHQDSSPLLAAWAELLEQRLDASPGQPYLLRPDGSLDDDVISYCNSESFRKLALDVADRVRVRPAILSVLPENGTASTGAARPQIDLVAYEYSRRRDPDNPQADQCGDVRA